MSLRDQLAAWNAANRRARWEYQRLQTEAEMKTPNKSAPLALAIVADVASLYMLDVDEVLSRRRTRELAEARMIAAWLLRREGLSYPRIGHLLDRDHTTVRYGVQKVEKLPDMLALATRLQAERCERIPVNQRDSGGRCETIEGSESSGPRGCSNTSSGALPTYQEVD